MRYGCAAVLMLISSALAASAQDSLSAPKTEARVSPDQVIARLMLFDRNGDGKVAMAELSERMQVVVGRGDTSGDGALDDSEIRALTARRLEFVADAKKNLQFYSFGDTVGLSTRTHILNTITDLRLASAANDEARRIAVAFADELEGRALANLKSAVAPMLTDVQVAELERNIRSVGSRTIRFTSKDGTTTQMFMAGPDTRILLARYQLTPEQLKTATAAVATFKTEQQLDDARRSALVAQLTDVLTVEERDNFRAALARRPVVASPGIAGGVAGGVVSRVEVLSGR